MTPNERPTPNSACTCAEGKGCPLHATGMTPDRERLLRQFHGSYFGKDEMWAEIDYLRQQLAAKDAEIERLTKGHVEFAQINESFHKTAMSAVKERDDYRTRSERLEAECAAMRQVLTDLVGLLEPTLWYLDANDFEQGRRLGECIQESKAMLASTTAGTDLLARLHAAEKERDCLLEDRLDLRSILTAALMGHSDWKERANNELRNNAAVEDSGATIARHDARLAEQERDMRQMVEALHQIDGLIMHREDFSEVCYGWCPKCKLQAVLALPRPRKRC